MTVEAPKEIERKWLVPAEKFPHIAGNFSAYTINQFYNETGERFRMTTDDNNEVCYQKTVKGEGGLVRSEKNTDISIEDYHAALLDSPGCIPICKTRFVFQHGKYKIELDKFNTGELYAEIEFPTEEEAVAFTDVPDWFGEEVTGDKSHSNHSIWLRMQAPPEEEKKDDPLYTVQRILVTGELTSSWHHDFYNTIRAEPAKSPLIIELSTPGGDVGVSGITVDQISSRKCPTLILCMDKVHSAGLHLLGISGSTRLCYLTTSFMYHRPIIAYPEADAASIDEWVVSTNRLGRMAMNRLITNCGLTQEEANMLEPSYDMYFNSFDALAMGEHGLVDGIIVRQMGLRGFYVWTMKGYKYFHFPTHDILEQPVLSDEEVEELGLPKITHSTKEPACFARWKQRNNK